LCIGEVVAIKGGRMMEGVGNGREAEKSLNFGPKAREEMMKEVRGRRTEKRFE
jgi:hypothetical protein